MQQVKKCDKDMINESKRTNTFDTRRWESQTNTKTTLWNDTRPEIVKPIAFLFFFAYACEQYKLAII